MRLDHIVLFVTNVDTTCSFYSRALGLRVVRLRDGRKELHFGEQKIKLYETGKGPELQAAHPTPGSLDVCFVTTIALKRVVERLRSLGVDIEEGPVRKMGAIGPMESIYLRDPDGNLIEISNYLGEGLSTVAADEATWT